MKITPELNATYAVAVKELVKVGAFCGLTEEQVLTEGSGDWMIDFIKQIQTALYIYKGKQMAANPGQGISQHSQKTPLPPLPNT